MSTSIQIAEEHTLANVAFAAVNARFALVPGAKGPRTLLDAVAPDMLIAAIGEGRRRGVSEFQLGAHATDAFGAWADAAVREATALRAAWSDADGRQRGAIMQGLKAGLMSEEAAMGAAVGMMFGPLGMTIGGALGGMLAGSKIDEDLARSVTAYLVAVDAWYDGRVAQYNATVPPAWAQDEAANPTAAKATTGGVGLLAIVTFGFVGAVGALGYGGYYLYNSFATTGVEAMSPATVAAPPPPAPALPTAWTAADGVPYRLEQRGSDFALVVVDAAATGGRYRAGETAFVLSEDSPGSYLVTHVVRPEPPASAAYQASGFADCERTVTTIDGTPLRASRTSTGLEVDAAVIELPARGFERGTRRNQIVGCTGLGEAIPNPSTGPHASRSRMSRRSRWMETAQPSHSTHAKPMKPQWTSNSFV